MEKKNIDWSSIGFGYIKTDKRYVSNYKNGAWDEGTLTDDANVVLSECAGVLQYAQTVFEGLKAYTTEDGRIVCFRPDLNASRMADSAKRLEMPAFPEDRFVKAVEETVRANAAYVPYLKCLSKEPISDTRLKQLDRITDSRLLGTVARMRIEKMAGYQEVLTLI